MLDPLHLLFQFAHCSATSEEYVWRASEYEPVSIGGEVGGDKCQDNEGV